MSETTRVERRPDATGRSTTNYPEEWGQPPRDRVELRAWILANIKKGEDRRERGETVKWLI
jgi:hypothetical protein